MTTMARRLERIWETPAGLSFALTTVDHKRIGVRYLVTASVFFIIAGLAAMVMRVQLTRPNLDVVSPEAFNQLFTMHGTTMIFFFATPMLSGFGNYFLPLMLGARDMAFPRLNAFGYWVFLAAGVFMYSSFFVSAVPDAGWFSYVPLTTGTYSPGANLDFWALGLIFLSISTTAGAINFIVTILKLRAPGMALHRLPIFAWSVLTTSLVILIALPPLTAGNLLLELDRNAGTHFFDADQGGNPLLWQHLFWFFGHPDVYIIFLPAVGIVATVIPVFVRRPLVGYTLVVLATLSIGFIGVGVWVHHMFAVGLPLLSLSFFGAASMGIAVPSGIQIFAWIATIWSGQEIRWRTPFLFMLGFIVLFVIGGISGVMFAMVPFDWQATDTYFVVAHFHYVLLGGAVFPMFGGLAYWLPKISGRLLNERLGQLSFWLMFVGFNLTFFPMHIAGLLGMPRRIYTYESGLGWDGYNLVETVGSFVLALGILVFILACLHSFIAGEPAGDDPWGAGTLEWATTSPPPAYNFATIPVVYSRDPLWDPAPGGPHARAAAAPPLPERDEGRHTWATTTLDAEPEQALRMPGDSVWPLVVAFGLMLFFYGVLPHLLLVRLFLAVPGLAIAVAGLLGWLWPSRTEGGHP